MSWNGFRHQSLCKQARLHLSVCCFWQNTQNFFGAFPQRFPGSFGTSVPFDVFRALHVFGSFHPFVFAEGEWHNSLLVKKIT